VGAIDSIRYPNNLSQNGFSVSACHYMRVLGGLSTFPTTDSFTAKTPRSTKVAKAFIVIY
jgi:hypothetical protein